VNRGYRTAIIADGVPVGMDAAARTIVCCRKAQSAMSRLRFLLFRMNILLPRIVL
jgi:hypothetical protein